jgi:hypothetical protein
VRVEELDAVEGYVVGVAGHLPLVLQVEEIAPYFLVTELVRRPAIVLRQPPHRTQIGLLGPLGQAA